MTVIGRKFTNQVGAIHATGPEGPHGPEGIAPTGALFWGQSDIADKEMRGYYAYVLDLKSLILTGT